MMTSRRYTLLDRLVGQIDSALHTLVPASVHANRATPGTTDTSVPLSPGAARHVAGLMRINHTGEVCAQALYQGQALTARLPNVRTAMNQAADEEIDHLAWCEERVTELGYRPSVFNPLWYGLSFGIGAVAGAVGDDWSLGFVAETEKQVCRHLQSHLAQLPADDEKSRAILNAMYTDEAHHATVALEAGGRELPLPVKQLMQAMSRVMTKTVYYL